MFAFLYHALFSLYYISYLQMTNANDPLLKLLASAPCP